MTTEVGIPRGLAEGGQVLAGARHLKEAIEALRDYPLEQDWGSTRIVREPVGVCALLAPWNWPMNQVTGQGRPGAGRRLHHGAQAEPALAALRPALRRGGGRGRRPRRRVQHGERRRRGAGRRVRHAPARRHGVHHRLDRGGRRRWRAAAAPSIKRVSQELGGKSANIVFGDVNVQKVVASGTLGCMHNSGQTCNAPTRMLVAQEIYDEAVEVAARAADGVAVGDPRDQATFMGPVAGRKQFETVRGYIETGIAEGARLVAGGLERPDGLDKGFFVRPTVFADVTPDMRIFRRRSSVRCSASRRSATRRTPIELANATEFGLSGYVQSADVERARRVAGRMRTGMVHLNGAPTDGRAPFGGYKQSGNGREWGRFGLEDFLEVKAVMGWERGALSRAALRQPPRLRRGRRAPGRRPRGSSAG